MNGGSIPLSRMHEHFQAEKAGLWNGSNTSEKNQMNTSEIIDVDNTPDDPDTRKTDEMTAIPHAPTALDLDPNLPELDFAFRSPPPPKRIGNLSMEEARALSPPRLKPSSARARALGIATGHGYAGLSNDGKYPSPQNGMARPEMASRSVPGSNNKVMGMPFKTPQLLRPTPVPTSIPPPVQQLIRPTPVRGTLNTAAQLLARDMPPQHRAYARDTDEMEELSSAALKETTVRPSQPRRKGATTAAARSVILSCDEQDSMDLQDAHPSISDSRTRMKNLDIEDSAQLEFEPSSQSRPSSYGVRPHLTQAPRSGMSAALHHVDARHEAAEMLKASTSAAQEKAAAFQNRCSRRMAFSGASGAGVTRNAAYEGRGVNINELFKDDGCQARESFALVQLRHRAADAD